MKSTKLSFDFSDKPELVEVLRIEAARMGTSQKALLVEALEAYFSNKVENALLLGIAERSFSDWDNAEDSVYDTF